MCSKFYASRSTRTCGLALDEVQHRLDFDNDESDEELSCDGKDLLGDFVNESERPGLLSSGRNGSDDNHNLQSHVTMTH